MYVDTDVDTDAVSNGFMGKINKLGNELKYFISGTDQKKEEAKNADHAKRELESAKRELELAKQELERVKRDKGN